jgi:hypothetical protein
MGNSIFFGGSRSIPVTLENDGNIVENTLYLDGKEEHGKSNSLVLKMLYNINRKATKRLSQHNEMLLKTLSKKLSKYNPQRKIAVNLADWLCDTDFLPNCENYTVLDLKNIIDDLLQTHNVYTRFTFHVV